ncbi:hypothetical protein CB0940_08561 [Cercospora beticola]|uniref:Heterokaryon incompatibility domain-containing protein n=1 Tax=Cercospora beticola TaxID=122368 RepID=A0A2G5HRD2_CERBT|nr:hypothetical protein CB0940_08561 [Cercospora beticola]PIA95097.1 hypothetical protein CB0940_08561 [Cercospora beticola]WPB05138.1 hypothetical protein RHO25_009788 [Cercospora beticola]CAK1364924.1 unnamed protein product [Cercospora beticola]
MLFQYAQLGSDAIRLIRFHTRTKTNDVHVTLEHQARYWEPGVRYSVLSYQPAGQDVDRTGITLNGRTRMIDSNAWSALADAAKTSKENDRYWLNALCINQQDKAEAMEQHRQLRQIYAGAEKVVLRLHSSSHDQALGDLANQAQAYIDQATDREALLQAKKLVVALDEQQSELDANDLKDVSRAIRESL